MSATTTVKTIILEFSMTIGGCKSEVTLQLGYYLASNAWAVGNLGEIEDILTNTEHIKGPICRKVTVNILYTWII